MPAGQRNKYVRSCRAKRWPFFFLKTRKPFEAVNGARGGAPDAQSPKSHDRHSPREREQPNGAHAYKQVEMSG